MYVYQSNWLKGAEGNPHAVVVNDILILTEEEHSYTLPLWRQLLWTIFFVAMATTATCGNLIVIWIVLWHKRMRTVTNYFIGKVANTAAALGISSSIY